MEKVISKDFNDLMLEIYNFRDRLIVEIHEKKSPDDILDVIEKRMTEIEELFCLRLSEIRKNFLNSIPNKKNKKARYIRP